MTIISISTKVSLEGDVGHYMRVLFFVIFLAPVVICLILMLRVIMMMRLWSYMIFLIFLFTCKHFATFFPHKIYKLSTKNNYSNRIQKTQISPHDIILLSGLVWPLWDPDQVGRAWVDRQPGRARRSTDAKVGAELKDDWAGDDGY